MGPFAPAAPQRESRRAPTAHTPRQSRISRCPDSFRMTMHLLLFRSLWTNGFDLDAALANCRSGPYDGVEGPVRDGFAPKLLDAGVPFIAEISTGGGYVPETRDSAVHLEDFRRKAETAIEARPLFLTV